MRMGWLGLVILVGCGPAANPPASAGAVVCPGGTTFDGAVCRPQVVTTCPAGMGFVEGTGCVPVVTTSATPGSTGTPAPSTTATSPPSVTTATAATPTNPCACAPGDLNCSMRCSAAKPVPGASPGRAFDRSAADAALAGAVSASQACAKGDGPRGAAAVNVVFEPSGKVSRAAVGAPFAQHAVGACIEDVFRSASVPPFDGQAVTVSKFITVR